MSAQTEHESASDPAAARTSRWRWLLPAVLLVVWLGIGAVGGQYQGRLAEVQSNDNASFLPASAESTEVADLQATFADSATFPAFVVVESSAALTPAQLAAVQAFAQQVPDLEVPVTDGPARRVGDFLAPGPVPVVPSQDGKAALVLVNFNADDVTRNLPDGESALQVAVESIRSAESGLEKEQGVDVYVAGPGGQLADFVTAFGEIDGILLGVALLAVLVILLVVYRSPIVPFLVILSAVFALAAASAVVYALAKNEVITLNGQSQGILFILVVGAATDYALLLVARYREELRRHDDRYEAMGLAWRRSVEPILASGTTVVLGLLCLLLSDLQSNKGLGPVGAIGIVAAMLAALTLLPAMLLLPAASATFVALAVLVGGGAVVGALVGAPVAGAVGGLVLAVVLVAVVARRLAARRRDRSEHHAALETGRWVFWPGEPHVGSEGSETRGLWARVAALVGRRPRRVWVLTALALVAIAAFLPTLKADGVAQSDLFLVEVESVTGQEALSRHFPGGSGSPTVVIGPSGSTADLLGVVQDTEGVASAAVTTTDGSPPGTPKVVDGLVEIQATLDDAADSPAAEETVRTLRANLDAVSSDALVGGNTAINLDIRDTSTRDRNVIIPVVLAVIFVVLALLLRALTAPVVLIVANVLSFAATLGAAAIVFNHLFDWPGADPSVPLFGFVFLVALGIDYSIFLMTRVREESARQGTRPGILTGLAVTGGVITSAGVVLASTFLALGILPILFLAQIAFIVAFGVLLDTLVVRSLLVPALCYDIGRRIWWPGRLARTDGPVEAGPGGAPSVEEPART